MNRADAEAVADVVRHELSVEGPVPDDVEALLQLAVAAAEEGPVRDSATWSAFQAGAAWSISSLPRSMFDTYEAWKKEFVKP